MAFKNRDLLVNLLPQGAIDAGKLARICLFRTNICRWPTFCFHRTCVHWGSFNCGVCSVLATIHCGGCSLLVTGGGGCGILNSCGPGGSACDPTIFCGGGSDPFVIEDLEDLVTLRRELHETLARLDEFEKEGLASGIQSRADAEAMERSLTEQLEHVRRQKEGLK